MRMGPNRGHCSLNEIIEGLDDILRWNLIPRMEKYKIERLRYIFDGQLNFFKELFTVSCQSFRFTHEFSIAIDG